MKLYIAARFQSYGKARSVMEHMKKLGHTITYDWTRTDEFDTEGEPINRELSKEQLQVYAENDIRGVITADCLILCADDSLAGAYIEMGIALFMRKPIIVVAADRWTIFFECENVKQVKTYEELDHLMRLKV